MRCSTRKLFVLRSFFTSLLQTIQRHCDRTHSMYTAISRKVVGKSARDNPERYCGWLWGHFSSKKFERIVREATDICLRVLKESNKSRFDSFSRYEQCIDHIPYYLSGLSRAHFFRQPLSKQLYIPGGWYIIQTMESVTNSLKGCFRLHRLNNRKRGIENKILAKK